MTESSYILTRSAEAILMITSLLLCAVLMTTDHSATPDPYAELVTERDALVLEVEEQTVALGPAHADTLNSKAAWPPPWKVLMTMR